jgi:hypothetical protein
LNGRRLRAEVGRFDDVRQILPLAVVSAEEEGAIFDDGAAEAEAELVDLLRRSLVAVEPSPAVEVRALLSLDVRRVGVQRLVAEILEDAAVEIVRARLRDDVDDRAARAPELRRKAVLVDLKLFHRLFRELVGRAHARASERLTEEGVVVVRAVNLQAVQSSLLAADGEVALPRRVAHDAGRERGEVQIVATADGQIFDVALVDRRRDGGARRLDDGASADTSTVVVAPPTPRLMSRFVCPPTETDRVLKRGRLETPARPWRRSYTCRAGAGSGDSCLPRRRRRSSRSRSVVRRRHGDAGHGRAVRVEHAPFDVARRGLRLRESRTDGERETRTQQERSVETEEGFFEHDVLSTGNRLERAAPAQDAHPLVSVA